MWCVAHRLELRLSDALSETEFKAVDQMLENLYHLYRKARKKLRQLKEVVEEYQKIYECEEGGAKPKKGSGSRWICHKLWGMYITHLRNILDDPTYNSKEKAKITGYLRSWENSALILSVCFFIDLLTIPSILSLVYQKEHISPVESARSMEKTLNRLELFMKKDFDKLPNVREFLSKVAADGDQYSYQRIELKNFMKAK